MKKFIVTSILAALVALGTTVMAQEYPDEYLGLPGDNLNLYAVMKLFQESETLEGFERSLNDENSRINNLDLNGDDLIDYLMVSDYVDGNDHTIVLRVALNRNETQDVAVFTVQRLRDGAVQIQLIGDEALYGKNYIIEPIYDETPNPGYMGRSGNRVNVTVVRTTPYEIAAWPLIRFIYLPNYVIWHSSWYWGYYPPYWRPWRPFYWHYYYGYHYNWYNHYYRHYRHWNHYRYTRYNDFYYGRVRAHSPYVSEKIRTGNYNTTYSHPEQRSEGEALYTKIHPDQARRTADNTPVIRERRPASQTTREQAAEGARPSAERRSVNTVNGKSGTNPSERQRPDAASRSTRTVNDRPVTKSSSEQNADVTRRSTTSVNDRPVTKSSSEQNAGVSRRSSPAASSKPVSRPETGQRSETARTSRPSPKIEGASNRRSSSENKKSTVSNKSDKAKASEDSKTERRRDR